MKKTDRILWLAIVAFTAATIFSCKKVVDNIPGEGSGAKLDTANSTLADRYYDSLYMYALQVFYWNDQLAPYDKFLPRKYKTADTIGGLNDALLNTVLQAKSPEGNPYEYAEYYVNGIKYTKPKYSYIVPTDMTVNGGASNSVITSQNYINKAKMTLDGKENDLGFTPGFITYSNINNSGKDTTVGYIRYVVKGSPADKAGLKRGNIIASYNDVKYTYEQLVERAGNGYFINQLLNAGSLRLGIYEPLTQKIVSHNLRKEVYEFNPVLKDTIINLATGKVGYIAYWLFTETDHSKKYLDIAFQKLKTAGINQLVVDLRHNGGGYVSTAEYLIELLAPASANGGVMGYSFYNKTVQEKKATLLKNVPVDYDKPTRTKWYDIDLRPEASASTIRSNANSITNLPRLYFIVSKSTASASELVINSLKPYYPNAVTLVGAEFEKGDANATYGKPIGFFEIRIGKYSMWMSSFETKNKDKEGGYFKGIKADKIADDDIRYDMGDPREDAFYTTLALIDPGYKKPSMYTRMYTGKEGMHTGQRKIGAHKINRGNEIYDMIAKPTSK